jgi:hypothetical protein
MHINTHSECTLLGFPRQGKERETGSPGPRRRGGLVAERTPDWEGPTGEALL